jgi:hypothetical protein
MNKFTAIENITAFLMETKGSVLATWKGKLTAKQQREMFGCFIGKGEITIDGQHEIIKHSVKVGFGQDYEYTTDCTWEEFAAGNEALIIAQGELHG